MKKVAATFLLLLLFIGPASASKASALSKQDWGVFEFFFYSWTLRSRQSTIYFDFPQEPAGNPSNWVAYMITPGRDNSGNALGPLPAPMVNGQVISFTAQTVVTRGTPEFRYDTEVGNTCVNPAHARLYVAKRNWAATNSEFDRWWASPSALLIAPGPSSTISVLVDPTQWTSVYGVRGDASPDATSGFYSAFGDPEMLGLSFGGGCFFGHGVYVSGGQARFLLSDFAVN